MLFVHELNRYHRDQSSCFPRHYKLRLETWEIHFADGYATNHALRAILDEVKLWEKYDDSSFKEEYAIAWKTKARASKLANPSFVIPAAKSDNDDHNSEDEEEEEEEETTPQSQSNKNPQSFLYKGVAIVLAVILVIVVVAAVASRGRDFGGSEPRSPVVWRRRRRNEGWNDTTANYQPCYSFAHEGANSSGDTTGNCNSRSPADCRRGELSRLHQRNNTHLKPHHRHYPYLSRSVDTVGTYTSLV